MPGPVILEYLTPIVVRRRAEGADGSQPIVDGLINYRLPDGSAFSDTEVGHADARRVHRRHRDGAEDRRARAVGAVAGGPTSWPPCVPIWTANVPVAREEMIRFCAPAQWFARTVRTPFTIARHHDRTRDSGSSRCSPRPRATNASTPIPTSSSGTGPSSDSWRSAAVSTSASACTWPASRSASWSPSGSSGCPTSASTPRPRGGHRRVSSGAGTTSPSTVQTRRSDRVVVPPRRAVHVRAHRAARDPSPESLADGQVLLQFLAAGVCGSDLPGFRGTQGTTARRHRRQRRRDARLPDPRDRGRGRSPAVTPSIARGDRVVGWASGFDGLMDRWSPTETDWRPTTPRSHRNSRSVCNRWRACSTRSSSCRDLAGRHVAVIGQGSIGLLFSLRGQGRGSRHVTGVDPVDRDALGPRSASTPWCARPATAGSAISTPADKPDVVIEAVGHQVATLGHAVEAAAFGGTVFYFGVPDDDTLSDQHAHHAAQQPDPEIRCDTGAAAGARRGVAFAARASRPAAANTSPTRSGSTTCRRRSRLACRPTPGRVKIAIVR